MASFFEAYRIAGISVGKAKPRVAAKPDRFSAPAPRVDRPQKSPELPPDHPTTAPSP